MSDIVRRLRDPAFGTETSERNLMNQAADEIERLRAAIQNLILAKDEKEAHSGRMASSPVQLRAKWLPIR